VNKRIIFKKIDSKKITFLIWPIIAIFYVLSLGKIPTGFFCDEAEIGVRAYQLIHGDFSHFVNPFFYNHFNYNLGSTTVLATAPFVSIFGLNEFAVRFSSVFFSLLALLVFYKLLLKYKVPLPWLITLYLAFTPFYFHISRINFGHLPSLFLLFLGYFFYFKGKKRNHYYILAGFSFGLAMYGHVAYMITGILGMFSLIASEFIWRNKRGDKKRLRIVSLFLISFIIVFLPVLAMMKNSHFILRLKEKNGGNVHFFSVSKVIQVAENYPKYYSFNYLFLKGESGLPGGFIKRHSIPDNGVFYKISLPILTLAFFSFLFIDKNRKRKKLFTPFFLLFFLYPLPDLITTKSTSPPYTLALFSTLPFFTFIIAYAFLVIKKYLKKYLFVFGLIFSLVLIIEASFFYKSYLVYPLRSANYWGWQYGPQPIINYFKKNRRNYDELYMTGYFNAPQIFLKFYDPQHQCSNCFIGGINQYNPRKKQLFAFRVEEEVDLATKFNIKKVIFYPNGKEAFYIGEFKIH